MKFALVLPGGGACGRWQLGVLKYLYDMGVFSKIDLVCGTSVGGLNTLLVGKYRFDFQKAVDMWERIKSNKDIFLGMMQLNNFFDFLGLVGQLFKTNKGKSLLDPSPLYHILDTEFGELTLKDLKVDIIITTTDLSTGERIIIDTVKCPDYKCADIGKATSAIPVAFPAVDYWVDGVKDLCVDGGLGRNNPVEVAIEQNATHVILIGTSPDAYPRKEIKNDVISIAMRGQDIIMHAFEEDAWEEKEYRELLHTLAPDKYPEIKILDVYPDESTGSALEFGNVEQFGKGYEYARQNLPAEIIEAFLK